VTPENAGKWGSVEGTRNVMNWGQLDAAYALAKDNGFPFRMHVMIWGNQQPSWIETLPTSEQRAEIEQWFELVAARYPDIDFVEVVNEPLHDPPNQPGSGGGNYLAALGGNGTTGWDWVLESFRLARQHFPNSKLMMNDYNIVNNTSNIQKYIQIINLLKAEDLIDHLGVQAHAFSINDLPAATLKANLDLLATTGLPIYVTELDIDGPTDLRQLERYQTVFPVLWEHPSVEGITLWGYRPGMWRTEQMAYLIENDGITERPALVWLRKYVAGEFISVSTIEVTSPSNSVEEDQTLQMSATINPTDATFGDVIWAVTPSPGSQGQATIDANGLLTAIQPGDVRVTASATDGSKITGEKTIGITAKIITWLEEEQPIGIYPNPVSNGKISVKSSDTLSRIDLLDLHGKMIDSWSIQDKKEIVLNVSTIPGMYILQIYSDSSPGSHKIIVR
jgi:endo-1,4-beta-xylanase